MSIEKEQLLRHELANTQQENAVLKGLVKRAAEELDGIVEEECSQEASARAKRTAGRLHQAAGG